MKNFKEFLLENNKPETYAFSLWITMQKTVQRQDVLINSILGLKKSFQQYGYMNASDNIKVEFTDKYTIDILIPVVNINEKAFDNIYSDIVEEVEYYCSNNDNEVEQGNQSLYVYGVPSRPIHFYGGGGDVYINFQRGDRIEKTKWYENLKEAGVFAFKRISNLEGGILSLLKIPKSVNIEIIDNYSSIPISRLQLVKIVKKHLETRDILACQDELLENGLKEYAKL